MWSSFYFYKKNYSYLFALRKILGNHVTQKGSLVNDEKLRFDFSHNDPISFEIISKIELLVNNMIDQEFIVQTQILDHKTAINSGATALFGEKYGDEVRVITIGKNKDVFKYKFNNFNQNFLLSNRKIQFFYSQNQKYAACNS